MDFGTCLEGQCISAAVVTSIFCAIATFWALGYGVGKAVAWTRKLGQVA